MSMKSLAQILRPLANIYVILLCWFLSIINLYFFIKPLNEYATEAGLSQAPDVLDVLNYYSPEDGYQLLFSLGEKGRHAYRLANYTDFVLPILLFLSIALPYVASRKNPLYLILPLIYLIADYIENLAEKYVLEIFPRRNDTMMSLACYIGLVKIGAFYISVFVLFIDGLQWSMRFFTRTENDQTAKIR